jgi:hypothetical protein
VTAECRAEVKRFALVEHHHRGGHYGEELWSQVSMDERADGDFVRWADYESLLHALDAQPYWSPEWVEGALTEHVRALGCRCEKPLLGYTPMAGPRCRLCGVEPAHALDAKTPQSDVQRYDAAVASANREAVERLKSALGYLADRLGPFRVPLIALESKDWTYATALDPSSNELVVRGIRRSLPSSGPTPPNR